MHFISEHLLEVAVMWYFLDVDSSSTDEGYSIVRARKSSSLKMGELKTPPCKKCRRERNRELVPSNGADIGSMEEKIWKEFPEDLFERVIARLPIATFFRFRSVCRSWNSLLSSHSFSQQCAEVPPQCPWFYTITHENVNNGAIYDPSLKKWHHLSLPSLPPKIIILPVTSAGGLVCFLDIGHRNFYVCNPLTQSFQELPSRSVRVWSRIAVGMILNTNGIGYKLLWLGCAGDYEVYDSVENAWTRPGNMPPHIKLPLALNFRSQTITIDGVMYFMRTNPDGLVSYDTVKGTWQQLSIPSPLYSMDHTLAECKGHIMLVGLLTKNAATCVCIWELQKMTLLWKEVDRMPNMMCLEFYGKQNYLGRREAQGARLADLILPSFSPFQTRFPDVTQKCHAAGSTLLSRKECLEECCFSLPKRALRVKSMVLRVSYND